MAELGEKPFRFWSNAKINSHSNYKFSNLFYARVTIEIGGETLVFPSAEHAYQAIVKFPRKVWHRFQIGGDLASLEALHFFYPQNVADTKIKGYKRKNMIGIVAKMASNKPGKVSLTSNEVASMKYKKFVFLHILRKKFVGNPELKVALLATGTRYLLEFVRGAKMRMEKSGVSERWGALDKLCDNGTYLMYGENAMGKLLMELRNALREE
jgi:predicted NAD-dependent protein-ADP-ribosyltransferase YbiA (DUF1768 family)